MKLRADRVRTGCLIGCSGVALAAPTFLLLAVSFLLIGVQGVVVVAHAETEPDAIDIEQIRREFAEIKLQEEQAVPAVAEAEVKKSGVSESAGTKSLVSENERLLSAEQDLLAELQRANGALTAGSVASGGAPGVEQASAAGIASADEGTAGLIDQSGRVDLDKIRARAIDKASRKAETPQAESGDQISEKTLVAAASSSAQGGIGDDSALDLVDAFAGSASLDSTGSVQRVASAKPIAQKPYSDARSDDRVRNLSGKVTTLESEKARLRRELAEARNRLMIAETEVERLASVLEKRNKSDAMRFANGSSGGSKVGQHNYNGTVKAVRSDNSSAMQTAQQSRAPQASYNVVSSQPRPAHDMPVATVTADKANLRIGPSTNDAPLMSISRGARLVVEHRQGGWYRVIAPTGARAWISAEVVAFGRDFESSPTQTLRIRGYDASLEREGFTVTERADQ